MLRSFGIAGAVTVLTLLLGVPLGLLLTRTDVPGRKCALLLHAFPMFLPPFLVTLGWFHLLGRRGLVGSETTSALLFSTLGLIAILTLAFAPVVTALVALGVHAIDPSLEEAARLVARPWRVATRVLLPLAWPAAALAALIVFALAFSELGVAAFLRVRTYPAVVFARLGGIQYAPTEAAVLALPLIVVALVLLSLERWLVRHRSFAVLGLRSEERPVLPLGRWRGPLTAACWTVAALSVLPLVSLTQRAGWTGLRAAPSWIGGSLGNSLLSATFAATVIVLLGVGLGPGLARRRPGTALFDALAVLAFVTPAALLGVGLIAVWNRPATQLLYGSFGIIVIGYVARYAAIGVRTIAVAVAQASPHLEEAAAATGARFGRRLVRIVVPLHARAVATAWLLALVFCLRDL
jgi:iron(III) transport system permease protein